MASLRKQSKGNSWQLRVTVKGERITISLPELSQAQAEEWAIFVEAIAENLGAGRPRDRVTNEWLDRLSREHRKKLSDKGLIDPDDPVEEKPEVLLSDFLREYFESQAADVKGSTSTFYRHTRKRLEEYFAGRTLKSITPSDAKKFRTWLQATNKRDKPKEGEASKGLSINTVRRRTGVCRQVFAQAIEDGLIDRNPFAGMVARVGSNKERQEYVPLEVFAKVLDKAPNARWRSLLVLARLGALRIPSEAQGLRWDHIAWDAKRISIVSSSKTEHHAQRGVRIIPLLPAIEKELLSLLLEAEDGAERVFPDVNGSTNLRTTLDKNIARAGVKQWPKLWQNLRASGATDFARSLPSHVAAEICGHTEQIAQEHYWTVSDSDLDQAIADLSPGIAQKLAQKLAHGVGSKGLGSSVDGSTANHPKTKKAREIPGFVSLCQLLAGDGFPLIMGDEGLENVLKTRGKSRVSDQLAQSLAQYPFGGLWEALEDADRATLFAVAAAMIERTELSLRTGDGQ
jgi:integrase